MFLKRSTKDKLVFRAAALTVLAFPFIRLWDISMEWNGFVLLMVICWLTAGLLALMQIEGGRLFLIFLSIAELLFEIILPLAKLSENVDRLSVTFSIPAQTIRERILTTTMLETVILVSFIIYFTHPKVRKLFTPLM